MTDESLPPPVEPIDRQAPLRDLTVLQQTLLDLYDPLLRLALDERVSVPFLDTVSLHLEVTDDLVRMLIHRLDQYRRYNPPRP